jgi:hypothetical protein
VNLRKLFDYLYGFLSNVAFWFIINLTAVLAIAYFHIFTNVRTTVTWWSDLYNLVSSLLVNGLVSFLFYYLVVMLPDLRKRRVIKSNLIKTYRNIKTEIIWQIVFASQKGGREDLETTSEFVESLLDLEKFKTVFRNGRESNEGYYAFENQMSDRTPEFDAIVLNLLFLQKQIEYILQNYTIQDQKAFDFLKRLEMHMLSLQKTEPGYDGSNALCGFLWQICTGWNLIKGYENQDPIEKLILEI